MADLRLHRIHHRALRLTHVLRWTLSLQHPSHRVPADAHLAGDRPDRHPLRPMQPAGSPPSPPRSAPLSISPAGASGGSVPSLLVQFSGVVVSRQAEQRRAAHRITPTGVGRTCAACRRASRRADHPHGRGGTSSSWSWMIATPDHPHRRGEDHLGQLGIMPPFGSPPRGDVDGCEFGAVPPQPPADHHSDHVG